MNKLEMNSMGVFCIEERQQVYRLFGKVGMPDRWIQYQKLVKTLGLDNITCKTLAGLDHRPGNEIRDEIMEFLGGVLAEK